MPEATVNWSKMEDRIRRALKRYLTDEATTEEALDQIDDAVGDETGRGYELPAAYAEGGDKHD